MEYSTSTGLPLIPCKKGLERNKLTNRCKLKRRKEVEYSPLTGLPLVPCKKGYYRNMITNRCKKVTVCEKTTKKSKIVKKPKKVVKKPKKVACEKPKVVKKPKKVTCEKPKVVKKPKKVTCEKPKVVKKPKKVAFEKPTKKPRLAFEKVVTPKKVKKPRVAFATPEKVVTPKKVKKPRVAFATPKKVATPKKTWDVVIESWKNGKNFPDIRGSVYWETSVAKDGGKSIYREKTAPAPFSMTMEADNETFEKYIRNKKKAVTFKSKGTPPTRLVCPGDTGKNFSHMGTFYKNASKSEMSSLWKKVAIELEKMLKKGETVYVSTHGGGISWLHVRLSNTPKYYVTDLGSP